MCKASQKRDEKWAKFEEDALRELRRARQRGLLSDSFDEIEGVANEVGKAVQAALLSTLAEQREPEEGNAAQSAGKRCSGVGRARDN